MLDPVAQLRYDRELETRAREAGQSLYRQWLKEELLYGGPSFWMTNGDGVQFLSKVDWDITVNTDQSGRPLSYTVARKGGQDGPSA
jgi:hypothetical protein